MPVQAFYESCPCALKASITSTQVRGLWRRMRIPWVQTLAHTHTPFHTRIRVWRPSKMPANHAHHAQGSIQPQNTAETHGMWCYTHIKMHLHAYIVPSRRGSDWFDPKGKEVVQAARDSAPCRMEYRRFERCEHPIMYMYIHVHVHTDMHVCVHVYMFLQKFSQCRIQRIFQPV